MKKEKPVKSKLERQNFPWGVELTVRPLAEPNHQDMEIRVEIRRQEKRTPTAKVTFTGANLSAPLILLEAQAWKTAFIAIVSEAAAALEQIRAEKKK